ncbi:MAG: hypothetical protein IJS07_05550 [Bacteroidales bacterium]|nr:hypothetical protein [Bacteroidales bacterium]
MKTITKILMVAALALSASACMDYDFHVDYTSPIKISFTGVGDNNIVTLDKGVTTYAAEITVTSEAGLIQVDLNEANNRTGVAGALISSQSFYEGEKTYTFTYNFTGMTDNQCVRVSASDVNGVNVAKNLVVSLTPIVDISLQSYWIETGEVYYGVYYAPWLGGRVYLRSTDNVEQYKGNIAVAFGEISDGVGGMVPAIMSPAARGTTFGLPNLDGLHAAKVGLTTLTAAQYNAITKVDASPIEAIADPTDDSAQITAGKVYVFKRDDGMKGLIYVESSAAKTAVIENAAGEWVKDTPYHLLKVSSKVIAQ